MSADWTLALAGYLVVGGLVLMVIYVRHRLTTTKQSGWVNAALRASDPERRTLRYRIMTDAVAPTLAALFIWALWPAALAMAAKWKLDAKREEDRSREERDARLSQPAVEKSELIERFSIEAIEAREIVKDPMNAAPALPFGHLGASWAVFRSKLMPQDEIWSFGSVRSDQWGTQKHTAGYAAVRNGVIVAHFISRRTKVGT